MNDIEKINAEARRTHAHLESLELAGGGASREYDRGMAWLDQLDTAYNVLVRLAQGRSY